MIRRIAQYTVKRDMLATVESAIEEFVKAIASAEPDTLYTAYRTANETTFIHFMAFPDSQAEAVHQKAAYTLKFVEVLYPNCEAQPQFSELTLLQASQPLQNI